MAPERDADNRLLQFTRDDSRATSLLQVDVEQAGYPATKYLLGQFWENLSFSSIGGISAQILNNPTFNHKHNLAPEQIKEFINNGEVFVQLYLSGGDPRVLRGGRWISTPLATGFGVAVLDDATKHNLQFGWSPIGYPGSATASAGRIGGAARLQGGDWPTDPATRWPVLEDGPAGVRQGVWLPIERTLGYKGDLWVRIGTTDQADHGEIEAGFRRRVATPDGRKQAGESLAAVRLTLHGAEWQKLPYELELRDGQVAFGEPVDFYVRWMPRSNKKLNLLLDRAFLYPQDEDDGLDPEVVALCKKMSLPLLRFPGGNYVSYHHWRDAVGPMDLRPTSTNQAWGGLDFNIFGTDEFINFCRKIGTRPHITVNSGTGTPEEAATWVEYCNGDESTPMGRLRAKNGHPEPYNVTLWEAGNEVFGVWQGGFHGSDENARRFAEFAPAMRAASPIPIELISCGSNFDFAEPGIGYDHTAADRRWHDQLLKQAPEQIDYISLHSLPENHVLMQHLSDEEAHNAVLAQVTTWERRSLPDLLARCDKARPPREDRPPIKLAITEWGALGLHPNRLMVENFGAVVYTGAFLNMIIRNSERIPIAIVNGFMHGGCIRKAYGRVFVDAQITAMQQYAPFQGATPLECKLTGPGYDVPHPADLGAVDTDIPFIDAVVCRAGDGQLLVAATNKHLKETHSLTIQLPGYKLPEQVTLAVLTHPEITARATPVQPDFPLAETEIKTEGDSFTIQLPPFSVGWINIQE